MLLTPSQDNKTLTHQPKAYVMSTHQFSELSKQITQEELETVALDAIYNYLQDHQIQSNCYSFIHYIKIGLHQ